MAKKILTLMFIGSLAGIFYTWTAPSKGIDLGNGLLFLISIVVFVGVILGVSVTSSLNLIKNRGEISEIYSGATHHIPRTDVIIGTISALVILAVVLYFFICSPGDINPCYLWG